MICFPNAKINIGLNIVSKRPDGYHNLETVFFPIRLCDALEVVEAEQGSGVFRQTGIAVDGDPDANLVMKALRLLKNDFDLPEVDIYLRKHIPFGAGLGGGSADAAFMLKLINQFAQLGFDDDRLEAYAVKLGADCPVFIRNKPVFAQGIGNIFTPIELSLAGYTLLLVKPDVHVSTQEAYSLVKPQAAERPVKEAIQLPISEWRANLFNDFEASVFAKHPSIGLIKDSFYAAGAVYACMSGSGSSVFGIFPKTDETGMRQVQEKYPEAYRIELT